MVNHPNATAAGTTSGATVFLIWLLNRYLHVDLSLYAASLIVGSATTAVLFIGREGLRGAALRIWRGSRSVWAGSPKAPAKG